MFFAISMIVSLLGIGIATYTDLKERIVPNKLNFGLAGIGLFIYAVQSVMVGSPLPFIYSFWGMILGFLFAWVLWKVGVFAGGDVKLFMGLGALNPFTPALLKTGIFVSSQFNIFPLTLFIYSTLAFLPYGLFVIIYKLSKNKPFQKKLWNEMKSRLKQGVHLAIFSASAYTILKYYDINGLWLLLIILAWGMMKDYKAIATIIGLLIALVLSPFSSMQNLFYSTLLIIVAFTLIKLLFSMRPLLSKEIKVTELEEGMIPSVSLVKKGNKIIETQSISLSSIIKYAKANKIMDLLFPQNEIISGKKARGVTIEELKEVKKLARAGKIPKTIMIKDSMPFVPTILLGYIICILIGDAWIMIMWGLA